MWSAITIMHALKMLFLLSILTGFTGNAMGSEIINGKKAKEKSMLYMASVQGKVGHICGGFLITEDFVVTAAHCDQGNPTSVVLGTHDLNKVTKAMRYSMTKCKHPSFVNVTSGNDIMLLKLLRKAPLGKKGLIKPIKLPSHKMKLKDNKKCHVVGWGKTRTNGATVKDLQEVEVPVINLVKCQKLWKYTLPPNVICAGGYGTKNGFCQGDSGGPLVCDKQAVGVVSFNRNNFCDYPDVVPNIYTDISKYLPWIKEILKKKSC